MAAPTWLDLDRRSFVALGLKGMALASIPAVLPCASRLALATQAAADTEIDAVIRPATLFAGIRAKPVISSAEDFQQMPFDIKYLNDGSGIELSGYGTLAGTDLIRANQDLYLEMHTSQVRYHLIDFSSVTHFAVSPEDAHCCARQDLKAAAMNPTIIIAIVAPTKLAFGISRIWDAYMEASGLKRGIFTNRIEAMQWLRDCLAMAI